MKTNPILKLPNNTDIISLFIDNDEQIVLIGTYDGKIIKMDTLTINAYLTGKRSIYAQVKDGFGNISNMGWNNVIYQLRNKIIEVSDDKSIVKFKTIKCPFSANISQNLRAVFTSPILYGGDDFIYWKTMEWEQTIENNTKIDFYGRVGESIDDVVKVNWTFLGSESDNNITVSLDNFNNLGQYVQVKAILSSNIYNITPSLHSLRIFYKKSCGVYFFTKKYNLLKNSDPKSIIIVANISEPQYTEVKFGISGSESNDWKDYFPVEINKMVDIPPEIQNRIKIGIKLSSYADNFPVVDEFALILTSDKKNLLNKI